MKTLTITEITFDTPKTETYSFDIKDENGVIDTITLDLYDDTVSWYSLFSSGIKYFDSQDEASEFAVKKIKSLRAKLAA